MAKNTTAQPLRTPHFSRRSVQGASMVELLVAFLIMAFGILGMSGLQATAIKNLYSAMQHSRASMLAYSLMDAMRANRNAAVNGEYNLGKVSSEGDAETVCEVSGGNTLAQNDHKNWFDVLKYSLGQDGHTCAAVECNQNGDCAIAIEWIDLRTNVTEMAEQNLTIRSRL